jgi:cyclin-dependent kinase 8/11
MVFAIKLVKSHKEGKNDVVLSSATVREIKLLRELNHDNVVHLHDVHVDPREKTLALVFEYADHDLHDIVVQSKQKPLSEYTKKSLMYQILKGVDYMHDAWVMHRDMKPQNILVVGHGRKRGQVKLADFGLARLYKEPIKALSDVERVVVTLWYRAPELLLDAKHYTKAVDMWAAGCIFAEIVNGRELFCGKEVEGSKAPFQKDQLDKIFKVLGMPTPQTWEGMEHLPEYPQVVQMGRERKYPTQSELKNAVKFGAGRSGMALYDLISRMLEYGKFIASDSRERERERASAGPATDPNDAFEQIRRSVSRPRKRSSTSISSRLCVRILSEDEVCAVD